MKKIITLLFASFIFFVTFVSAQEAPKTYQPVTFLFTQVTIVKDTNTPPATRAGNYELTFPSTPGIVYFRDRDKETTLKIVIGDHLLNKELQVYVGDTQVDATVVCFMAKVNEMDIVFSTVFLNDKEKTVYAFGIALDEYSLLLRVEKQ